MIVVEPQPPVEPEPAPEPPQRPAERGWAGSRPRLTRAEAEAKIAEATAKMEALRASGVRAKDQRIDTCKKAVRHAKLVLSALEAMGAE